jgi:hypothetical protein
LEIDESDVHIASMFWVGMAVSSQGRASLRMPGVAKNPVRRGTHAQVYEEVLYPHQTDATER